MSEAEAVGDFAGLLARVRSGAEILIESETSAPVLIRTSTEPGLRRLSESLRLAREHRSSATLDGGFADDLSAVIGSHPEPLQNAWD